MISPRDVTRVLVWCASMVHDFRRKALSHSILSMVSRESRSISVPNLHNRSVSSKTYSAKFLRFFRNSSSSFSKFLMQNYSKQSILLNMGNSFLLWEFGLSSYTLSQKGILFLHLFFTQRKFYTINCYVCVRLLSYSPTDFNTIKTDTKKRVPYQKVCIFASYSHILNPFLPKWTPSRNIRKPTYNAS